MHNRLSQAWGKSANGLRSARVKQKKHLFLGVMFVPGLRGHQGKLTPIAEGPACSVLGNSCRAGGRTLQREAALAERSPSKRDDSQGVLFRRDSLKTAMSLGTSDRLKLHPCSALYPAPLHHPVHSLTIFCVDYFKTLRVPSPQVLVPQQSAAENDQGTRVTCVRLRLRGLARTQPQGPEGSQGVRLEELSKTRPPSCFSLRSIFRAPRVEGETSNFVACEPTVCTLSNKRIMVTVMMKIIAATM